MNTMLENLFILPPGNLIYHTIVLICLLIALVASFGQNKTELRPVFQRMRSAIWIGLVLQLGMLIASVLAWLGFFDTHAVLPPIDRLIIFLFLIWISWMWLFPRQGKRGDVSSVILSILGIAALASSYLYWNIEQSEIYFNYSWIDWCWIAASLLVVLGGLIILIFQKPNNWLLGFIFLFISGIGLASHLLMPPVDNDFSPWIRITQAVVSPLLIGAFLRPKKAAKHDLSSTAPQDILKDFSQEKRRFSSDLKTIQNWMQLSRGGSISSRGMDICKATAVSMLADQCFLLYKRPMDPEVIIQTGYDLLREQVFPGATLARDKASSLLQAVYQGTPYILNLAAPTPADLEGLRKIFGVKTAGSLLFQPILQEEKPWGGLLLYSPYAHREWNSDDLAYAKGLADLVTPFLTNPADDWTTIDFQKKIGELEGKNQEMQERILEYQSITGDSGQAFSANEMISRQQELEQKVAQLQEENNRLASSQQGISDTGKSDISLDAELRLTLEEVARLQSALQEANLQIDQLRQDQTSQEEDQFERAARSNIQKNVNINEVIDKVMSDASTQIREKNISLLLDLPEQPPLIAVNQTAVQQILLHLLQNAISASPVEGVVRLAAAIVKEENQPLLSIKVKDSGGGIADEALPMVFSGWVQGETTLIKGVGDTKGGLSLAKGLVETNQGQIWVESEKGIGATFSVMLPLDLHAKTAG